MADRYESNASDSGGPDWLERSPHPFAELDSRGTILRTNVAARDLVDAGGADARRVRDILPEDLRSRLTACLDSGAVLEGLEVEVGDRCVSWSLQPSTSGESVAAFGFEVTPWKRSEAALLRKDALLEAVGSAARIILEARGGDIPLDSVLARLGQATGVSRIYVFRNSTSPEGDLLASQVAEWTSADVEAQIDNPELQGVPYEAAGMGRWARELAHGVTIAGKVDDFPPEEQELLRGQEIVSLVVTPILLEQRLWGFIGFDDCELARTWSRAELEVLRAAADTVAAALLRKEALDALEESRLQLRHVQRMEAVGRLAGGIAHDFNNLLTGILSNAEMLLEDMGPASPGRSDVEAIRKSSLRASRLTRQLLAFSRRQAIRPSTVDLLESARETEEIARRVLGENIRIETRLDPSAPPVWADRVQVEQVLMNLVVNARDAMPEGGRLLIHVREAGPESNEHARGGLAEGKRYVLITVADSGRGMEAAIREKVFEPFFTTKSSGTGMGLSIVYGIVTQLGGSVWIDSTPGVGTEVTVAFPVKPGFSREDGAALPRSEEPASGSPGGETILVVEDDRAVLDVTTRILERAGYTVLRAESAKAGLATLRSRGDDIDLVLSDVGLPDQAGTDMALEMRRERSELPIAFMSGFPGHSEPGRAANEERVPLDFLPKPFTQRALIQHVRSRLDAPSDARGNEGESEDRP